MNKIFDNPQQAAASKMNEMPSALEMAEKLIQGRPDLFPGNPTETEILITRIMIKYKDAAINFLDKPKSNMHPIFLEALKPFGIK